MNQNNSQQNIPAQGSIDTLANAITRGLAYTENGGAPDIENPSAGKTGETKSIFQYEPETWKADAGKVLGNPNAPLTPDNETYVAKELVKEDLKKGMTVSQIASSWNAGAGEADAYTGKFSDGSPSVGVNKKYGIKYDVPAYAKKVLDYTKQFLSETQSSPETSSQTSPSSKQSTSQSPQGNPPMEKAIAMLKKAGSASGGLQAKQKTNSKGLLGSAFSS